MKKFIDVRMKTGRVGYFDVNDLIFVRGSIDHLDKDSRERYPLRFANYRSHTYKNNRDYFLALPHHMIDEETETLRKKFLLTYLGDSVFFYDWYIEDIKNAFRPDEEGFGVPRIENPDESTPAFRLNPFLSKFWVNPHRVEHILTHTSTWYHLTEDGKNVAMQDGKPLLTPATALITSFGFVIVNGTPKAWKRKISEACIAREKAIAKLQ